MATITQLWWSPVTHTRDWRTPKSTIGDYTDFPMYFPSGSQVSRSTRLYYRLLPRHHSRLPDRYTSPPVLRWDFTSEKTKKSNHRRSTWCLYGFPYVRTLCFSDALPTPSLIKRHVASSTIVFNRCLRFLQRSKPLNISRYSLFHHLSSSSSIPNTFSANHETSRLSQSSTFFSVHSIIKR